MLKSQLLFLLLFIAFITQGSPKVPSHYQFADIKLIINEGARKQIQADVNALHRNQTYLRRKAEKVDLFFPIIERIFREENVPEDFKYLAIQESALTADAVSSSNAVGFWQFKKASAEEVGLRVDNYIDERMNITASTHGAAKYLKKNNRFFDNWIYALLAYNTGPGGAQKHVIKKYHGAKKMEITKHTHWYVKKFLAYKIAFENEIHKDYTRSLVLHEYDKTRNKTIKDLATLFELDHQKVEDYNKWLRKGRIPSDKTYTAIIPIGPNDFVAQNLLSGSDEEMALVFPESDENEDLTFVFEPSDEIAPKGKEQFESTTYKQISHFDFKSNEQYPKIKKSAFSKRVKINGIPGFKASTGDDLLKVLIDYGVPESKFLKYNDMTTVDELENGQIYYFRKKKNKARTHYHVVKPGENAWSISQKYGIKVKKLLTKNRLKAEKDIKPGMVVWLRFIRPADVPVVYKKMKPLNMTANSTPNKNEYPKNTIQSVSRENPETKAPKPLSNVEAAEQEDSEFVFEEINDDTEYINEHSYVDLKNVQMENDKEQSSNSYLKDSESEIKNVKIDELYHIVKSGETLFSISRNYGVGIVELRQWNALDELDVLSIGQKLLIQKSEEPQKISGFSTEYKTYIVKKNDSLYGIARKNNISIEKLMDLNDKEDFSIREGEILKIKAIR